MGGEPSAQSSNHYASSATSGAFSPRAVERITNTGEEYIRHMRLSKTEILEYFGREDRNYRLAMLCTHWIRDTAHFTPSAISQAKSLWMKVAGRTIAFSDLAAELEDVNRREIISSQFLLTHLRALVRVPFELLKDYCEDFDKTAAQPFLMDKLKKTPWFEYTRLVRNAVSHNFRFAFDKNDRAKLPVAWNGITIDGSHDKKEITYETLWHRPGYELFLEMKDFADSLPEPVERP